MNAYNRSNLTEIKALNTSEDSTTIVKQASESNSNSYMMDASSNRLVFPEDFVPGIHHIVCGRGKRSYGHFGNKNFLKNTVSEYIEAYSFATTKQEKSTIVQQIVHQVETKGGFIRYDTKLRRYVRAEDNIGREKTSQSLRDCLKNKYKSSKEIKREVRRQKRMAEEDYSSDTSRSMSASPPVMMMVKDARCTATATRTTKAPMPPMPALVSPVAHANTDVFTNNDIESYMGQLRASEGFSSFVGNNANTETPYFEQQTQQSAFGRFYPHPQSLVLKERHNGCDTSNTNTNYSNSMEYVKFNFGRDAEAIDPLDLLNDIMGGELPEVEIDPFEFLL